MPPDPYKLLAERLDALPNGFPPTPDGAELRLLAKLFTPEEALLACQLRLTPETPAQIAARVGGDPATGTETTQRDGSPRVDRPGARRGWSGLQADAVCGGYLRDASRPHRRRACPVVRGLLSSKRMAARWLSNLNSSG